jgi:hypothetical protein
MRALFLVITLCAACGGDNNSSTDPLVGLWKFDADPATTWRLNADKSMITENVLVQMNVGCTNDHKTTGTWSANGTMLTSNVTGETYEIKSCTDSSMNMATYTPMSFMPFSVSYTYAVSGNMLTLNGSMTATRQ